MAEADQLRQLTLAAKAKLSVASEQPDDLDDNVLAGIVVAFCLGYLRCPCASSDVTSNLSVPRTHVMLFPCQFSTLSVRRTHVMLFPCRVSQQFKGAVSLESRS